MKVREFKTDKGTKKGEVTAYLSLIFILLVSFAGAMLESASIQNAKNYRRADMSRAAECIFAEYHKTLLKEYDIFALEGTYETGNYSETNLYDRLTYYGAGNMEQEILKIQFLTDNGCQAFYEQVAAYMEHKYGLDGVKKIMGKTDVWRQQEEEAGDYARTEEQKQEEFAGLLEERAGELPEKDNPISHVNALKSSPFLTLAAPKDMQISEKSLTLAETLSHRERNQGYGDFSDVVKPGGTISALLFGEYVLEHFSMASDSVLSDSVLSDSIVSDEVEAGALDYEVEYILEGKASDRENLEAVAKKLLLLRFVPNFAYLQTDGEKKAEAEALALTLCAVLALPAVTEAAAQMILLAWAYGESVMDVRSLLGGNRVPLVKTKESWQLGLSSLLTLGTEEDYQDGKDTEGGLSYKDYLRMLLFLKSRRDVGMRTLDLIEQNLRTEYGQKYFHADFCISRVEFSSMCRLRRGITYRFPTYFGYH